MEKFARIFETKKTQLLVFVEYDNTEDVFVLHHIGEFDFGSTDYKEVYYDRPSAMKALSNMTTKRAKEIVNKGHTLEKQFQNHKKN